MRRSSGCAARQETTPALKPAILSITDAERALCGALDCLLWTSCFTGGNARGIAGLSDGFAISPRTSSGTGGDAEGAG